MDLFAGQKVKQNLTIKDSLINFQLLSIPRISGDIFLFTEMLPDVFALKAGYQNGRAPTGSQRNSTLHFIIIFNQSWGSKMKKVLLPIAALTLTLASVQTFASDGTVSFTGSITQSGCVVTNATNQTISVAMGNYSSSALSSPTQTAGPRPFEIDLSKCTTGSIKVRFDGTAVSGYPSLLKLTPTGVAGTDPSTSVGIQITDLASGGVYTIGDTSSSVPFQATDSTGALNIKLAARYYAFAKGTPSGQANATTNFSIEYQ